MTTDNTNEEELEEEKLEEERPHVPPVQKASRFGPQAGSKFGK